MSSPAAAPPPLDNHRARDLGYRDAAHLQHEFEKAARIVRDDQDEMVREATSADKLRLYGYYKQATCGKNDVSRPKDESLREVAKWEAWHAARNLDQVEAMARYIEMFVRITGSSSSLDSPIRDSPVRSNDNLKFRNRQEIASHVAQLTSEIGEASSDDEPHDFPSATRAVSEESRPERRFLSDRLHLFFIWVDPSDPLSERMKEWPLPPRYAQNVRDWEMRYQVKANVYGGKDCLDAIARVSSDPLAQCPELMEVYLELSSKCNWIKMVDIARVAIIWLQGGMYLDTDMELGPRTFSDHELFDDQCWFVQDYEAILQNHFIRSPPRHAFIRHLLHVFVSNALEEKHVVQATGPCALTSAYKCFSSGHSNYEQLFDDLASGKDMFSREQVKDLTDRICERLLLKGYPDPSLPSSSSSSSFLDLSGNPLPSSLALYPPSAFYVFHWREDASVASTRSRANCYAVHTWDTTWAGSVKDQRGYGYGYGKRRGYGYGGYNGGYDDLADEDGYGGAGKGYWDAGAGAGRAGEPKFSSFTMTDLKFQLPGGAGSGEKEQGEQNRSVRFGGVLDIEPSQPDFSSSSSSSSSSSFFSSSSSSSSSLSPSAAGSSALTGTLSRRAGRGSFLSFGLPAVFEHEVHKGEEGDIGSPLLDEAERTEGRRSAGEVMLTSREEQMLGDVTDPFA